MKSFERPASQRLVYFEQAAELLGIPTLRSEEALDVLLFPLPFLKGIGST